MKIAHISDIHCNFGNDFNEKVFDQAVILLNKIEADLIFISGDITTEGLLNEYKLAKEKINKINGKTVIVSGNHDERNLGFKLFPEFFGDQNFNLSFDDINLIGLSSSEPDRDDGRLGRERHSLIENGILKNNNFTVIGFHHHLVPVPNSGRENNIIEDAGETLDIILKNNIPLVLMGHRHVPFGVRIHNSLLVNAGTFSSNRTRAHIGNTFNLIEIENNNISVFVYDILKQKNMRMIDFKQDNNHYENHYYNNNKLFVKNK